MIYNPSIKEETVYECDFCSIKVLEYWYPPIMCFELENFLNKNTYKNFSIISLIRNSGLNSIHQKFLFDGLKITPMKG